MSIVPNDQLVSVDSLNLPTFELIEPFTEPSYSYDTLTQYLAVWKQIILRNFQVEVPMFYRTKPEGPFLSIPTNSERIIRGWGSYFEVITNSITPQGEMEMVLVNINKARRKV